MDNFEQYGHYTIVELRSILSSLGGAPGNKKKEVLIEEIIKIRSGKILATRSRRGRPSRNQEERYPVFAEGGTFLYDVTSDSRNTIEVEGYIEIMPDGSGYITDSYSQNPSYALVHVPVEIINKNFLRTGDKVACVASRENAKKTYELKNISTVNGSTPKLQAEKAFEDYLPKPCVDRLNLSATKNNELKLVDSICPMAKGQRGIIIAPPGSGKTYLIKLLAEAFSAASDLKLCVLLPDERPEDIEEIKSSAPYAEIYSSTFDSDPLYHVQLANLCFNRCKNYVEDGKHVVLLVDSLSKLIKNYTLLSKPKSKQLYEAAGFAAVTQVRKLMGLARNLGDSSLTIIATVNLRNEVFFDGFIADSLKEVSNLQIVLDATLAEKRVYPAINIKETYSKGSIKFLSETETEIYDLVRKIAATNKDAPESIIKIFNKYAYSEDLLSKLKSAMECFYED